MKWILSAALMQKASIILDNLEEIMIYPAAEKTLDKGMVSFLDYFPEEEALIFLDEPNRLTENGQAVEEEYQQSLMHREEKGEQKLRDSGCAGLRMLRKT